MIKSRRSITAAPDKIIVQTFFEGIDKGWNCGLVDVSNRKLTENSENRQMMWYFYFLKYMPYPDEKRWYYTQNDAFNLILKSNFD